MKKIIGIIAAILTAVLVTVILITVFTKKEDAKKIDLNKYLEIDVSGYDRYGMATYTFDKEGLEKKYGSEIAEIIFEAATGYLDKEDDIENGEKITFKWECNDELLKEIKDYKVVYSDKTIKVKGLEEGNVYDYFDYLNISFGGYEGHVSVYCNANFPDEDAYSGLDFYYKGTNNLKNGDTIVVTLEYGFWGGTGGQELADYLYDNGEIIAKELQKEFVVTGVDKYITSVEEIPADVMEEIHTKSEELCREKCFDDVLTNYGTSEIKEVNYVGSYIFMDTDGMSWDSMHKTYFLYEVIVHNTYKTYDSDCTIYWCSYVPNIHLNGEGEISYNLDNMKYSDNEALTINSGVIDPYGAFTAKFWYEGHSSKAKALEKLTKKNSSKVLLEDSVSEN